MPQRKEVKWAQLRVGVMVAAALIVLAVGIFLISGQTGFLTRKYTLRAYFATAGGLRQGAQVQLAGIPCGNVSKIRISEFNRDPSRAVEVVMKIERQYQQEIRADSVADVATAGLLGEAYVDISRGNPTQAALADGGVMQSRQEQDIKQIVQNANDVISNLRVLSAKLNDIGNQITSGQGTLGELLYDDTLYKRMDAAVGSVQTLVAQVQSGKGTIGKFLVDPTVYDKTVATVDRLNKVMDQIQNGNGTVGRLMSDPALYNQLKDVVTKANAMVDNINKGQGTLGKLVTDDRLYTRLNSTVEHVDSITARMDKGEGSLGKLSTDPTLYNNLSSSSESLKEFLTEFRKNPRKYLTLHLHVF
ncbi:MAG TPA: MlaD family protein [Terriglobia bacterium]|nr:MlaD family protein [Terriglobia bacterium]